MSPAGEPTGSFARDVAAVSGLDVTPTILNVICHATGMRFAAVARVTADRWVACAVSDEIAFGLEPGGELPIETTICSEIRDSGCLVAIDHVSEDDDFRSHPVPKMYGFESYISVPIFMPSGLFFGTLCAIDPKPANVRNPGTIGLFELFANLIALHLDAQDRLHVSEAALSEERRLAELQNQFVAVLGHDLRNPLSAIQTGALVLLAMPLDEKAKRVATVIDHSATRMSGLIANVLDFARGRLGGGLTVTPMAESGLAQMLEQVAAEIQTAQPERVIHTEIACTQKVDCDRLRIGQLLSNLIANALAHGDPAGEVWVRASTNDEGFELSVSNQGDPIPKTVVDRLFEPFQRGSDSSDAEGLGLGLYIASEIARAHAGTLEVTSAPEETRFTLRIPRGASPSARVR